MPYTEEPLGTYFKRFSLFSADYDWKEVGVTAGDLVGFSVFLPPAQSLFFSAQKKKKGIFYPLFSNIWNMLGLRVSLRTLFPYVEDVYPGIKTHPRNKDIWALIEEYPVRIPLRFP